MFVNDLKFVVHHAEMVLCGGRPLAGLIIPPPRPLQQLSHRKSSVQIGLLYTRSILVYIHYTR